MPMVYPENISEEERKEREHDVLVPILVPVLRDGKETGYYITKCGDIYSQKTNKFLAIGATKKGQSENAKPYWQVELQYEGKPWYALIHRLVAEAFCPNDDPEHKTFVDHINANTLDCWYKNLEWVTPAENSRRAIAMGLVKYKYGSDVPAAKYTEEQIHQICKMIMEGKSNLEIGHMMDIDPDQISNIRCGRVWKSITSQYDFSKVQNYPGRRTNHDEQIAIVKLIQQGLSGKEISERLSIPEHKIYRLRRSNDPEIMKHELHKYHKRRGDIDHAVVHRICYLYQQGYSPFVVRHVYPDIPQTTLYNILHGDVYKSISSQYQIPKRLVKRVRITQDEIEKCRQEVEDHFKNV